MTPQPKKALLLKKHDQYEYSSIQSPPFFQWPGKKNLAVYIALNLEHFAFGDREGAELAPKRFQPDILRMISPFGLKPSLGTLSPSPIQKNSQHVMEKKSSMWLTHPGKIAEHFSSQGRE